MAEILFINACARENSRTRELAGCVLEDLQGQVEECRLYELSLPPLDAEGIKNRHGAAQQGDFSDSAFLLAKQFAEAQTIVIAAPYWDLMFPAVLKSYLECVSVAGISFRYSPTGMPVGLCRAKNLYYVTTAGGYIGQNDFGYSYIKALAGTLFGIENVKCFAAEGLDISDTVAKEAMQKAKAEIRAAALRGI